MKLNPSLYPCEARFNHEVISSATVDLFRRKTDLTEKTANFVSKLTVFSGGEGEDRTRAPETRPNSLANCPLNPLGTSPLSVAQTVYHKVSVMSIEFLKKVNKSHLSLSYFVFIWGYTGNFTKNTVKAALIFEADFKHNINYFFLGVIEKCFCLVYTERVYVFTESYF